MTERESIKVKIAKLMALATNDGAADNEAETALRQAEKLMRKHKIDLAEISERTGTKPIYNWTADMCPVSWPKPVKAAPLWFGWVAVAIGKFTDTKVAWFSAQDKGRCIKFEGDETDVEYAMYLMAHIREQIRMVASAYDAPGLDSDTRWANREEFRHAMARRIKDRINKLHAEMKASLKTSSSTALVLVDDKIKQRDAAFGLQLYNTRKASHIRGTMDAHLAGREAGNKVSLNRPLGSPSDVKKLS